MADPLLDEAGRAIKAGQGTAAYELLLPQEAQRAGDPSFDYVFGVAAIDAGHPSKGVFALERVLSLQPDNTQARAEIARAYLMLGELEASKREFENVKAASPPPEVLATIDKFMGLVDRGLGDQGTTYSKYIEFGFGDDNNVNGGTSSDILAIPGFTLATPSQNMKQHDSFATVQGGINMRHAVAPDLVLTATVAGQTRGNLTKVELNSSNVDVTAGATFGAQEHRFSVTGMAGTQSVASNTYRNTLGVQTQWMYLPDEASQFSTYAQFLDFQYPQSGFRDAQRSTFGIAYAQALQGAFSPVLFAGAYLGGEAPKGAGLGHLAYEFSGARLGGQWNLRADATASVSVAYENRLYKNDDPLFAIRRKEDQVDLRAAVAFSIGKGWTITPQASYTNSVSTVDFYSNQRVQYWVSARMEF